MTNYQEDVDGKQLKIVDWYQNRLKEKTQELLELQEKLQKLVAKKHQSLLDTAKSRFVEKNDSEDDDTRACFPCPFCYVEIELSFLCSHLQEEHCFNLKNAVCPLCAENLGKDVVGHFVVKHASSLKRKKKPQSFVFWTGRSRELSLSASDWRNDSAPDPLFSPFLGHRPPPNPKNVLENQHSSNGAVTSNLESHDPSSVEGLEQDIEEKNQRVAFVQQLMASVIF